MKSDCIWVSTKDRRTKEVIERATDKVMACYGSKITKITAIQGQFKHNDHWNSHVWYEYTTHSKEGAK